MKPEKPALGISRNESYDSDYKVFHVECSCTDPDHAVVCWIEVSEDPDLHDEVEVTFYVQTNFASWRNFWERIKIASKVLFGRGYEQNHSLLLKKQAALNLSAALTETIDELSDADSQSN